MTHRANLEAAAEQAERAFREGGQAFVSKSVDNGGCPILIARRESILQALRMLKDTSGLGFLFLADLTAYDCAGSDEESRGRFAVVYNLLCPERFTRIRVKTYLAEGETVATASGLWSAANWAEREVFDMFGIRFEGHPDLRRILMDVRWVGHPLRKDYPLRKSQLFNDAEPMPIHLLKDENA